MGAGIGLATAQLLQAQGARVLVTGRNPATLAAAVAKSLADSTFQRDGSFAIAGNLNECIAAGDWSIFYSIDEAAKKVTAADVQRVANQYMNIDQSTTGWFVPTTPGGASGPKKPAAKPALSDGPYYYRTLGVDDRSTEAPLARGDADTSAPAPKAAAKATPKPAPSQYVFYVGTSGAKAQGPREARQGQVAQPRQPPQPKGARQAETFLRDHRPWGWFETLATGMEILDAALAGDAQAAEQLLHPLLHALAAHVGDGDEGDAVAVDVD